MTSKPIEMHEVTRSFGDIQAIRGISLTVEKGEILGLIGHNGAGKSTLFKLMLGLLPPSSGDICINGTRVDAHDFRQARRRIGYLPESFVTYDNLTGLEVLHLFADLKQVPRSTCADVLALVGLRDAAARRVRGYSKGMRQRLGFAQVLLGDPDLIFLDEPTNGLDPEGIHDFYLVLRAMQSRGATIVITSHILAEIQERVDRLLVLHSGRMAALGTLSELRAQRVLPSMIRLHLRANHVAQLTSLMSGLPGATLQLDGDHALISCASAQKVAVLGALAVLGDAALDIAVHEPSLEDVFLGYGGIDVSAN